MKTLDQIAIDCGTDKSSLNHNYCVKYERYLPFDREAEIDILEIGIAGGHSLKMWKQFYSKSTIIGVDINPNCKDIEFENGIEVVIGNATEDSFLASIKGEFDLIIDDGSHESSDMIASFEKMFSRVKSGGVYIIEDTSCSYWADYKKRSHISIIDYLKNLIDDINFFGYPLKNRSFNWRNEEFILKEYENPTYFQKTIDGILICNSTVLIFKK